MALQGHLLRRHRRPGSLSPSLLSLLSARTFWTRISGSSHVSRAVIWNKNWTIIRNLKIHDDKDINVLRRPAPDTFRQTCSSSFQGNPYVLEGRFNDFMCRRGPCSYDKGRLLVMKWNIISLATLYSAKLYRIHISLQANVLVHRGPWNSKSLNLPYHIQYLSFRMINQTIGITYSE